MHDNSLKPQERIPMIRQPTLTTRRLLLRPYTLDDAGDVHRLAGERDIAYGTLNMPHPYEEGMADEWIRGHREGLERGDTINFAIVIKDTNQFAGGISLVHINQRHKHAELGYWIGKPFWDKGYCTEAAQAIINYAFKSLGLNRVFAYHFTRNPSSGRVMQKLGMTHEGTMRSHVERWREYEDLEIYGILHSDWDQISG